jgi:hypothetical protein
MLFSIGLETQNKLEGISVIKTNWREFQSSKTGMDAFVGHNAKNIDVPQYVHPASSYYVLELSLTLESVSDHIMMTLSLEGQRLIALN